jgi:hypothetical protein
LALDSRSVKYYDENAVLIVLGIFIFWRVARQRCAAALLRCCARVHSRRAPCADAALLTWRRSASSLGVFLLVDRLTCAAAPLGVAVVTLRTLTL